MNHGLFSRVIVPLVFILILVYLAFSGWDNLRNPYSFVTARRGTVENSIDATGWVVRTESVVRGEGGLIQLRRVDGEKVGKGQILAQVYQDENYEETQRQLLYAQSALTALQFATDDGSPSGRSLEALLMDAMKQMRLAGSTGSFSNLEAESVNYRKLVLRREYLVSGEGAVAMDEARNLMQWGYNQLQSSQSGAADILAQESGIFLSELDGYEPLLTPESVNALSPSDLAAFAKLTPTGEGGSIGKLITSSAWYYAVTLPEAEANDFTKGEWTTIYFESISTALPMQVEDIGEPQNGWAVVVFSSSQDMDKVKTLREETCRVVFQSAEGIVVPKNALRVDEEKGMGVYVLSGHLAAWRPVTVLLEDENSYLLEPVIDETGRTRPLAAGDEIVLAAAELYDGKVVR